ncbi:MAG: Putative helicase, partial [Mesotoga prima]
DESGILRLLEGFFESSTPRVLSAKSLATELAKRTRFLRDEIIRVELESGNADSEDLEGFYEAFKDYLISDLTVEGFADLYSQTITYGLFAARTRATNGFNRQLAYTYIPKSIGILSDVFQYVSMGKISRSMVWMVDDISAILAAADVRGILDRFYHEGKGSDPIIHFYETFLAEYDPSTREKRGVYYTPEPVVSYIVRSLNIILKEKFGKADGFASEGVTVLDPAAGTMTFLAQAAKLAVEEYSQKYGEGMVPGLIRDHILKDFYAFELMMAPYAIGHLKMSFFLEELGYRMGDDERFKLYLTNTLEKHKVLQTKLPGTASLSKESALALEVKEMTKILIVLGNPPYSVSSDNKSEFIEDIMNDYKESVRSEKNIQPLSDDYVKFLRFAQYKIDQAGRGAIGFITNHNYLDGPIFRGMRESLMKTFDEIYIYNLHGNSMRREKCPDGSKDENVFDIRTGVAIALLVKHDGEDRGVFYSDLWGKREDKYSSLVSEDISTTEWKRIEPYDPQFYFTVAEKKNRDIYSKFVSISEIFETFSSGIKTHRDHFVVDFDKEALINRIRLFVDPEIDDDAIRKIFGLKDNRDWKLSEKRRRIMEDPDWKSKVIKILYRPFDFRWIFYHKDAVDFDRREIMSSMLNEENLMLAVGRAGSVVGGDVWDLCLVSDRILDNNIFRRGGSCNFPYALYKRAEGSQMFDKFKVSNISNSFSESGLLETIPKNNKSFMGYLYSILNSQVYRKKFANLLKVDFPRIPFTSDTLLFEELSRKGRRLIDLHLLSSSELDSPTVRFPQTGTGDVDRPVYEASTGRVYLNNSQYFETLSDKVWRYTIGGYQVCEKWLKDRKGRTLSNDEILHYLKVVTALSKTIEIHKEIDEIYPLVEKSSL